ncbi:unnamed protein product [Clavelina lepadiformis]|uniref:PGAP2-interacting protein n=1 Tax=Clavelina lepadiformis TaxID=159417 RepID=A0ABP0FYL6_CLALP
MAESLIYESVIGYAFWCLVHHLGPMIWFYPLNELEISGYEIFALVIFSPVLFTCGSGLRSILKSSTGLAALLMIIIGGCASFQAETTLSRLIILSAGIASAYVLQCALWWQDDIEKRKLSFWSFTIGFMAMVASKIWYVSISPMWNDYVTNKVLITFLTLAAVAKVMVEWMTLSAKPSTLKQSGDTVKTESKVKTKKQSCLGPSLAYGATCFVLHAIFGEVSVVCRYAVQGYPNTGPLPNPWGGLILVMLTAGLFLSMHTTLPENKLWSACGIASSMGLMFLPTWWAYGCGTFLALYIMSVWPSICEKMVACESPGKSLMIGNATYLAGILAMIWCTAYNFVPLGELARERTYIVIAVMMPQIAICATKQSSCGNLLTISLEMPEKKYYVISRDQPTSDKPSKDAALGKIIKKYLFAIALLGLVGFHYRNHIMPTYSSSLKPELPNSKKEFSALIWTFHFGYDNEGWPSLDRAASLLNHTGADVITLLESDASKPYLGNKDIAMWLGEKLGMYADFGPSTRDHTWGNLLLSKYPIIKSKHHLLPSPEGELAPSVSATVNISGTPVDFVVTHMGNDRDDIDRRLQAESLANLCDQSENPVVFLGYVTSAPGSRDYKELLSKGRLKDIDSNDKERWCEYIMYRGLTKLGYARISHGGLSDTELQMARWEIKEETGSYKTLTNSKDIPQPHQFNPVFGSYYRGHWYGREHHFHMSTPKYFVKQN